MSHGYEASMDQDSSLGAAALTFGLIAAALTL
jgi:hypothetical protein